MSTTRWGFRFLTRRRATGRCVRRSSCVGRCGTRTLRATAEYADRWNVPGGDPSDYATKLDVLFDHCEDLGTNYDAIGKTIGNWTVLRGTTEAAHAAYEELTGLTEDGPMSREEYRGMIGTPAEACELLSEFADVGLDTFVVMVPGNDQRTRELFADEVMPEFA